MKKVAIYGQAYSLTSEIEVFELVYILQKHNIDIYFEKEFYELLSDTVPLEKTYKTFSSYDDLSSDFDVMFTVGGDGTFLRSVIYIRDLNIPVVGINTGRLGFLATIRKGEIALAVAMLLQKAYTLQERSLLQIETSSNIKDLKHLNFALNEITVSRKNTTSMIGIKTHIDKEYLTNYWADGLIISTPTGSTGYSLSCGGPVLMPNCNSLIINPMSPHNLSARPMIISNDMVIDLEIESREDEYLISLDSRITAVPVDTKVTITKADFTIKTVLFDNQSFLKTLRSKLLWGEDTRNK